MSSIEPIFFLTPPKLSLAMSVSSFPEFLWVALYPVFEYLICEPFRVAVKFIAHLEHLSTTKRTTKYSTMYNQYVNFKNQSHLKCICDYDLITITDTIDHAQELVGHCKLDISQKP